MKTKRLEGLVSVCLGTFFSAVATCADQSQNPGEPLNVPAQVQWQKENGAVQLSYEGKLLFDGHVSDSSTFSNVTTQQTQALTQTVTFTGKGLRLEGAVSAPDEAVIAETQGVAQQNFPLVRTTSGGPSRNLRNNAVYDRGRDWMLAGPNGSTQIEPQSDTQFRLVCTGDKIELTFEPRVYQVHKNITYYNPWTYQVRRDSITGWCSWWAYRDSITQADVDQLLAVWKAKHFADYGYRFIQVDLGYGTGEGMPQGWLNWNAKFPSGMTGYANAVRNGGFEPGVWTSVGFNDEATVSQHPDWFIRDAAGHPFKGQWISYGVDATVPQADEAIVRPTFRGFHDAGMKYVKIDTLRHLLYNSLNLVPGYAAQKGLTNADIFRRYLMAARDELGRETFILSCWGVLPESVGLADGCRLGGDGYNPGTLQQYNSWNGIVWRNDPDHCDVYPQFKPAQLGDVSKVSATTPAPSDTIIRPAMASIAGSLLMLSDRAEVYRDDANLEGLRRSSPVIFSVPGQLYDFDDSKSRNLLTTERSSIRDGSIPTSIDADGTTVCPWWLNEFNRPFEHWNVLHRVNWSGGAGTNATVKFTDLGLDPAKTYLVYEFWSHKFIGDFRDSFETPGLPLMGIASYSIREQLDHPQIVSTNRHLSQGGVDLIDVKWRGSTLSGASRVVNGDRYELAVYVPATYAVESAEFAGKAADYSTDKGVLRAVFTPAATGDIEWRISFHRR
jgi:hypothetical protein